MAVLIALLFTIMVKSLYQGGKIKMLEWDMAMITAADYTLEFTIPESAYKKWYEEDYRAGGDFDADVPPAMSLKKSLKNIIESTLTEELNQGAQV